MYENFFTENSTYSLPDNYYNWIIFKELGDKYPVQSCDVNINKDICGKSSEIQSETFCLHNFFGLTNLYLCENDLWKWLHNNFHDVKPFCLIWWQIMLHFRSGQIVQFQKISILPCPHRRDEKIPGGFSTAKKIKRNVWS